MNLRRISRRAVHYEGLEVREALPGEASHNAPDLIWLASECYDNGQERVPFVRITMKTQKDVTIAAILSGMAFLVYTARHDTPK